jgi:hypothetical protein
VGLFTTLTSFSGRLEPKEKGYGLEHLSLPSRSLQVEIILSFYYPANILLLSRIILKMINTVEARNVGGFLSS